MKVIKTPEGEGPRVALERSFAYESLPVPRLLVEVAVEIRVVLLVVLTPGGIFIELGNTSKGEC